MWINHDRTHDPTRSLKDAVKGLAETEGQVTELQGSTPGDKTVHFKTPHEDVTIVTHTPATSEHKVDRFRSPQNLLAMLFLGMFAFNLLVMALDFPRFTLVAVILAVLFFLFFVLWLGSYFEWDLIKPIHAIFASIYAVANRGFYLMVFVTLFIVFAIIYITRWLDYWEVLPNEILHHHGPLSDLERYPTMNLKFDKEIPDVLEWLMLGSGRLVLHVPNVSKALVLENVLFITAKEDALKKVMSRLDVRVTTDQEAGETVT
jgi:signal transduction histidine kinase